MKSKRYWKEIASFKGRLARAIPHEELKALHRKRPELHLLYAGRQFALIGACSYLLWHATNPLLWLPLALLQGFAFFNMTTPLHEVVHNAVFHTPRPRLERALGLLYAISSGISASQFTRWLSRQGRGSMPKVLVKNEQSSTELAGRFAGVGYWEEGIGSTISTRRDVYFRASVKIASAKPCQVVMPLPE